MIDKKLICQIQNLKENKNFSITEISKITGRARNTIYKILKEELNYIPYNRLVKSNILKTQLYSLIDRYFAAKSYIYSSYLGETEMTPNNLSFKSENLVVDWIFFNAKGLIDPQPIAKYLLQFGFNLFQLNSFQEGPTRKKILCSHPKNKFNVIFSRPIEY